MPVMLGCSTSCPNCKHQFTCCPPAQGCCRKQRTLRSLSGGGVVMTISQSSSPQISPSTPLEFLLPPITTITTIPLQPPEAKPEVELERLSATMKALRLSGWYYDSLKFDRSDELLKNTEVGTFLVRNSSDPRYLFALSLQTKRGPKSVRLFYMNGYFRLDAQTHLQSQMPIFPGVVDLVDYYVRITRTGKKLAQVWVAPDGKISTIYVKKPLRKDKQPPSLKHLSRLAINRALHDKPQLKVHALGLPVSIAAYLMEYPYSI